MDDVLIINLDITRILLSRRGIQAHPIVHTLQDLQTVLRKTYIRLTDYLIPLRYVKAKPLCGATQP